MDGRTRGTGTTRQPDAMPEPPEPVAERPRRPSLRRGLRRGARRLVDHLPGDVGGRFDVLRGFLTGDLVEQADRLRTLVQHRHQHEELRDALQNYRFVLTLMLSRRLKLFERLSDGARTAEEIAMECGIAPQAAELLLRVLEATGVCVRRADTDQRLYGLSEFAYEFLIDEGTWSYAPLLDLLATFGGELEGLEEALHRGEVTGALDVFSDVAQIDAMLDAVNAYLDTAARELLTKIELPAVEHVIAGSMGVSFSAVVLERFPDSRVTYGCLDHLVQRIPKLRARFGVDPGRVVETHSHGGEPTADRWGEEAFDLVFLTKKMILSPSERLGERFARKAYDVLNPGGVTVLWEAVHPDEGPTSAAVALESMMDLGVSPTGCVLTHGGMKELLRDIGYRGVDFVPCMGGETSFIVARK